MALGYSRCHSIYAERYIIVIAASAGGVDAPFHDNQAELYRPDGKKLNEGCLPMLQSGSVPSAAAPR